MKPIAIGSINVRAFAKILMDFKTFDWEYGPGKGPSQGHRALELPLGALGAGGAGRTVSAPTTSRVEFGAG